MMTGISTFVKFAAMNVKKHLTTTVEGHNFIEQEQGA